MTTYSKRRPHNKNHNGPQKMKPIQARYNRIMRDLHGLRPNPKTKEIEKDVAYLINKIQAYGFEYFPNHYIFDDVAELEQKVKQLRRT